MINFNNLQSLMNNETTNQTKAIKLKAGQIFNGQVLKFFPDNIALVQLGGLKLHAKLNAPLTTDVKYWFQVVQNEEMVELKLVGNLMQHKDNTVSTNGEGGKIPVEHLLKQTGLVNSKENQHLVRYLVQNQLPVTRDTIIAASEWLKQSSEEQSKVPETIKLALTKELPLTKNVLNSILAIQSNESLTKELVDTLSLVRQLHHKSGPFHELDNAVSKLINDNSQDRELRMNHELIKSVLQSNNRIEQQMAQSILEKKGFTLGRLTNPSEIVSAMLTDIKEMDPEIWKMFSGKTLEPKQLLNQMLNLIDSRSLDKPMETQLLKTLQSHIMSKTAEVQQYSAAEHEFLIKLEQALVSGVNWQSGNVVAKTLQLLFRQLGFQFEHDLSTGKATDLNLQELKPALLSVLREEMPIAQREKLEHLLHRITGMQLLATEQQGPMQQLIFQLPLVLGNYKTDMTMQWTGKKQKNGQIDPDYCRILFYLDLETLKETVVDVHVQNRIVNIQIYNENPLLDMLVKQYQRLLKNKLKEHNYALSSIKVASKDDLELTNSKGPTSLVAFQGVNQITGVDYKI